MDKTYQILFSVTISGTFFSILMGVIFFGSNVFNIHSPLFQFLSYGIIGSLSFYFFRSGQIRNSIYVNILLFLMLYLLAGRKFLLAHLLHYGAVVLVVYFYAKKIYNKIVSIYFVRPFVLAALLSILFIAVNLMLTLIYYTETTRILPFRNVPVGFLIGLGLGIGFEVANFFNSVK